MFDLLIVLMLMAVDLIELFVSAIKILLRDNNLLYQKIQMLNHDHQHMSIKIPRNNNFNNFRIIYFQF